MEYEAEFREAITKFAMDFYSKIIEDFTIHSGNFIFSPMSIYSALLLLTAGADGETLEQLLKTLQIPEQLRTNNLHKHFGSILTHYFKSSSEMDLNLANRLFLLKPIEILSKYKELIKSWYNCSVELLSSSDAEAACVHMNEWVKTQTKGKIEQIFPPGSVSGDDILVHINALYFRGTWMNGFPETWTHECQFHGLDGHVTTVQMMRNEAYFDAAKLDELSSVAVRIPFRSEVDQCSWDMLLLVPNEKTGLPKLLSQLQAPGILNSVISGTLELQNTTLMLPKFSLTDCEPLNVENVLYQCGIHELFSSTANLSEMIKCCLPVSRIRHKAIIEVDEVGVSAAASTDSSVMLCGGYPLEISADRPFFFALLCNSNVPVFMGHIVKLGL